MTSFTPFFFERLGNRKYLISNLLGGWKIIDDDPTIEFAVSHFGRAEFRSKGFGIDAREFTKSAVFALSAKYKKALSKPSLIMVVPTLRCDHSCLYCQVSRAPLESKTHDLSIDVMAIAEAIDLIAAPSFKLEIQGGEPLLRTSYIQELVAALKQISEKSFEIVITSALGPDLDLRFIDWAGKNNVAFSISFDGVSSIHQKNRKWIKPNEVEHLLGQIEILRAAGLGQRMAFVNTITKDLLAVHPQLIALEVVEKLGASRLYSRPISHFGFASTTRKAIGYDTDDYLRFMDRYLDVIIDMHHRGIDFFDDAFGVFIRALFRPEDNGHVDFMNPSGYGLSAMVINYDGKVFGADEARMLYESTRNEVLPLAQITDDTGPQLNELSFHAEAIARSFKETKPHCDICAYSPFCGSDPMHDLVEQNDLQGFMPTSESCRIAKHMFGAILTRYSEDRITDQMISRWLM